MKRCIGSLALGLLLLGCSSLHQLRQHGQHYQQFQDYQSLLAVVEGISLGSDTTLVKKILGTPIDMGFDYRYLIDSVGPTGCAVGAVFHIGEGGKIDQKWLDEICE